MAFVKTLNTYSAFLYPNSAYGGTDTARINLYCADGYRLYLIFRDTTSSLPANTYSDASKTGVGYERISRYADYIDLIRNEKPISVTFATDSTPISFVVYAASETPGEGEI